MRDTLSGPAAQALAEREKRALWHPFTQMRIWEEAEPLFIERGESIFLIDRNGRRYFDANSSLWVNIHGHGRPEIDAAIRSQLDRIAHSTMLGLTHEPALILAEKLLAVCPPGLSRVFYSDSGSTAVEIALKMAFQYWRHRGEQRHRFLALRDSYHGDTIGSVSVGGISLFHSLFRPLLFEAEFAPSPSEFANADAAAAAIDACLAARPGEFAAVVMEPLVQGAAGMLLAPSGTLRRLREICDRHGVLLIADEVATGFGRTGRMWACNHEEVTPDILCCAKGLTGGYLPLAATITTEAIYAEFLGAPEDLKTFFHGHSYTGNPLACAAAIASLDLFESDRVIESLPVKIDAARQALSPAAAIQGVKEVRQCGLMCAIEICKPGGLAYSTAEQAGARACLRAREMGLITRPLGNSIVYLPPLAATPDQHREMVGIILEAIRIEARID